MRMSVTFKSDGIEFRLTFWGYASRSAKRPRPAAAAPVPRSTRRPIAFSFVDIYSPFDTKTYSRPEPVNLSSHKVSEIESRSRPARGTEDQGRAARARNTGAGGRLRRTG